MTLMSKETFIGYEYRDVNIKEEIVSIVIDGYENFGWQVDSSMKPAQPVQSTTIKFKRDRAIRNKAELTRLQRQFDAVLEEIQSMEKAKGILAATIAYIVGVLGTAFVAGSVFALNAGWIVGMIFLAVPGLVGWIISYPIYKRIRQKKVVDLNPLIEKKYDELYEITKRGNQLL